jgi:hypothetical protein
VAINYIKLNEIKKVVSTQDEAIDKEKSSMVDYQKEYDISHLVFVEGQIPDYFIVNNIGSSDLVTIQQEHYVTEMAPIKQGASLEEMKKNQVTIKPVRTGEMLVKYFKAGCKKIISGDKTIEIDDAFIDTIPSSILQEIGSYIMMRSTISESKKK